MGQLDREFRTTTQLQRGFDQHPAFGDVVQGDIGLLARSKSATGFEIEVAPGMAPRIALRNVLFKMSPDRNGLCS